MKELSIEEKAKAYDEAIKRASKLRVQNPFDTVSQMMEHVFPELKESEDERIRKEIISFIQDDIDEINLKVSGDYDDRDEDDIAHQNWCKGAIAWLEKQGEQKVSVVEFNAKDWYVSKVDGKIHNLYHSVDKVKPKFEIGNWVISTLPGIKYPHLITDIKDGYYIFGEDDDHAHIASNDDILKLWTIEDARDGDVLATKDNCICIFDNTVEEGKYPFAYCGLSMYGFKVCDRTLPFTHDNVYPATKEQRDLLFQKMKEAGYEWDAEKKELKLLITNGGDFESENCEQKPDDMAESKFNVGDWVVYNNDICQIVKREEGCNKLVTTFGIEKELVNERNLSTARLWTIADAKDGDVLCAKYGNDEMPFIFTGKQGDVAYCALNSFGEFVLSIAEWLLKISVLPATKEQRDLLFQKMYEAGFEWNPEKKELKNIDDEEVNGEDYGIDGLWHAQRILEKTLGEVEGYQSDDGILDHKAAITAVKKLYEQKPAEWKQENVEELSDFENAMMHIGHSFFGKNAGLDPNDTNAIKEQAKLLLGLTNMHKWTEEDEENFRDIIGAIHSVAYQTTEDEEARIEWLKSLKPQNHWKPSDEQIRALEYIINNAHNTSYSCKIAKELLEQLKKIKGE